MNSLDITGFNNVDEVTSPEKLQPNVLVALDNMRLDDEIGIATTRKGFSNFYTKVDTAAAKIHSLFNVNDVNANNYLLAGIGTKLRKSLYSGGSWGAYADLKTGLTSNAKLRMTKYGNQFLFTNGADAPFYSDLTTNYNMSLPIPIITEITLTKSLTGNGIDSGWYRYVLVFVTKDGQHSNPSNALEVYLSPLLDTVTFANIQSAPSPSDSRIVSVEIYRTPVNQFNTFLLLTTLNIGQTSFVDLSNDKYLNKSTQAGYMTPINSAGFIASISDRIVFGSIDKIYTNRVFAPARKFTTVFTENGTSPQITAGTYYWAISHIDVNGNESDLTILGTYVLSTTKNIIISGFSFPYISSDPTSVTYQLDPNIKSIRFYRTHANPTIPFGSSWPSRNQFYFLADYSISSYYSFSLTFTDNFNDTSLTNTFPKETVHNYTETVKLTSSVVYSNLYTYLEFPELNYIEVYPDDNDAITGIFDDDNGILIPKQNNYCKIYTTGDPSNWQCKKIVENIGCDQPNSIYKFENSYFFVFRNRAYIYSGGQVKEISYKRNVTFQSVTSYNGATFYNKCSWYVLAVNINSDYYLLCYDTKLDAWYKFNTGGYFDSVIEKKFGADFPGMLLCGGDRFVTYLTDTQTNDSDNYNATAADVVVNLKTKDYSFPDNFTMARLMFFYINYYRSINTIGNSVTFTITNPVTGVTKALTDLDNTSVQKVVRIVTDKMTGNLQRAFKLNLTISGEALQKFYAGRLDYNSEQWNITEL